jgi:hypothetical protein
MNQPNPRKESHRRVCGMFWKFAALAVLAQLLWIFILGGRTLLDQRLVFSPQTTNRSPRRPSSSTARRATWCCATTPTSTTTGSGWA